MASSTRLLATLYVLFPLIAAAGPRLAGSFEGELGTLTLRTEGERVFGFYESGGKCGFDPDRQILEGQFEGRVLVGTVVLCQRGDGCAEKVYPVLAFYQPENRSLVADIRLDAGCSSPGLDGQRLVLRAEGFRRAAPFVFRGTAPRRKADLAQSSLQSAHRALKRRDYQRARAGFQVGISYDEKNWAAYSGLGLAEIHLGQTHRALKALERAVELKEDEPETHFNMAWAYGRLGDRNRAMSHLKTAVRHGFDEPAKLAGNEDLARLLGNDPAFKRIVTELEAKVNKPGSPR